MMYDELHTLLGDHDRVAVYLTMPGCGPCHAVRPWVSALFDDPDWRWVEVDTTENPEIAGQLLVFAHPTLVVFADGREAARFSRVVRRAEVERLKGLVDDSGGRVTGGR